MYQKIENLANKLKDYRVKDYLNPKEENIKQWLNQFSHQNQEAILDEMINLADKLYLTEIEVDNFLDSLIDNQKFTGNDPTSFWQNVSLLNIQKDGSSQNEMVQKLTNFIKKKLRVNVAINCIDKPHFIYIDDFLFSGSKLFHDIESEFVNDTFCNIDIVYIGYHTAGQYYYSNKLEEQFPNINFKYWKIVELENRLHCINESCVLWPTTNLATNPVIQNFLGDNHRQQYRDPFNEEVGYKCINNSNIFRSEKNRQILEEEFTLAGLKIINKGNQMGWNMSSWKPLGFSSFDNLGFGSMVVSYRNCPNNAPLCLWWGDWNSNSIWYPLFQRTTYSS